MPRREGRLLPLVTNRGRLTRRRSTATSCRSTSSSTSFTASPRPRSTTRPSTARRTAYTTEKITPKIMPNHAQTPEPRFLEPHTARGCRGGLRPHVAGQAARCSDAGVGARGCRDHRRGQRVPRKLAIRRTGHSAGGQSLPLDSTVVDLSGMNAAVGVDGKGRTVRCQTGARHGSWFKCAIVTLRFLGIKRAGTPL
jgi:hypothetical protein